MLLLHGNFLWAEDAKVLPFLTSLRRDLAEMDPETVERLLRLTWRESLTGAWFAGLNHWQRFMPLIGDKLLQSSTCYAGQGYCFALARFGGEASGEYLRLYLDEYLPRVQDQYDQHWHWGHCCGLMRLKARGMPKGIWSRAACGKDTSPTSADMGDGKRRMSPHTSGRSCGSARVR